jgi:hypothetical protein
VIDNSGFPDISLAIIPDFQKVKPRPELANSGEHSPLTDLAQPGGGPMSRKPWPIKDAAFVQLGERCRPSAFARP